MPLINEDCLWIHHPFFVVELSFLAEGGTEHHHLFPEGSAVHELSDDLAHVGVKHFIALVDHEKIALGSICGTLLIDSIPRITRSSNRPGVPIMMWGRVYAAFS